MSRLLGLGSVVVDLVLDVPALPAPGGDVLAIASRTAVGGGLNVLVAATAAGLPAAYAGGHGTGPFGDLVRGALSSAGVAVLLGPTESEDSGFCVVLVDPSGERTFATTIGAEGRLTPDQLATVEARPDDLVYVSGYDLAYPHRAALAAAVEQLPAVAELLLDPGPLVADLDTGLLARVLARTSWLTLNAREAEAWTGCAEPAEAAASLRDEHAGITGVVVRAGPAGCVVAVRGEEPVPVAGVPVAEVVDTNGAGDVHVGTFAAGLAHGLPPAAAAARANAAAAESVTRRGPGLGAGRMDG